MATVNISGISVGTALHQFLLADDIQPGSDPSYQVCKTIYLYHPMGAKLVESPIKLAMSQQRKITIPKAPEGMCIEAFVAEWKKLHADSNIAATMYLARIYGIGSIAYLEPGKSNAEPLSPDQLAKADIYFNVLDPLNTSGSLVLNQDPNAPDFQKNVLGITIAGNRVHVSRSCTIMNEMPVYIAYTASSFGFVGRSVYQRALYPLKSFIQSMITDNMVTRKAGLIVTKIKQAGSIINAFMEKATGQKRSLLQQAETDQVISIAPDEDVSAIDLQNIDKAMITARTNIIENIATAAGTPAKLLLQESFAEGFGEGTEDFKSIVQHINGIREQMQPLYDYFDLICMRRAWSPDFYARVQAEFSEQYGNVAYEQAFYMWRDSFRAVWPSLMEEPESELVKIDKEKLDGLDKMLTTLLPALDPENKAKLIEWAVENLNEMKDRMFRHQLFIDIESLLEFTQDQLQQQTDAAEAALTASKPGEGD